MPPGLSVYVLKGYNGLMEVEEFEQMVSKAVDELPEEFASMMDNVDVVVQDWPTRDQLRQAGVRHGGSLLGLYEGIPLTRRGSGYGMVLPDKITIFQKPIEARCERFNLDITREITAVVKHEIAHHFGISDERLEEIEEEKQRDIDRGYST